MSMIMSPTGSCNNGGGGGQFGDTTYTKVFVGGLAWETQKETMKKYFEQFGDILEAVVITDKATGRSKGYGFVTFREAEAAMRACVDAAPVIDGRRANCNLASLGVQKSKPSTPKHQQHAGGGGGRNFRIMSSFQTGVGVGGFGGAAAGFHSATFPHYAIQQPPALPYNLYGYSPYSADYTATYPTGYYSVYGGGSNQYQAVYGGGLMSSGGAGAAAAYYPYLQVGDVSGATTGYATSVTPGYGGALHHQYPHHHLFHQYSPLSSTTATTYAAPPHHHYAPPISLAPSPALHTPVCFAVPQA